MKSDNSEKYKRAKQSNKGKEKKQLHSAMITRQHPTMTSSPRISTIVSLMMAIVSSLSLVSSFGTQSQFNTYQRRTTHHEIARTHWPFYKSTTRLYAAENEKWKSKSNSFQQRKIRISAANHQTSMKWVVESIEKVLQDERRRGTGSKNSSEDDEALMDALNKMQRGALISFIHACMDYCMHYCTLRSSLFYIILLRYKCTFILTDNIHISLLLLFPLWL